MPVCAPCGLHAGYALPTLGENGLSPDCWVWCPHPRFFLSYPQSKPSFPQFDQLPGSAQLRARGAELAAALNDAVKNMDDMDGALSPLSDLLAYKLRVDPANFRVSAQGR